MTGAELDDLASREIVSGDLDEAVDGVGHERQSRGVEAGPEPDRLRACQQLAENDGVGGLRSVGLTFIAIGASRYRRRLVSRHSPMGSDLIRRRCSVMTTIAPDSRSSAKLAQDKFRSNLGRTDRATQ